MHPLFYVFLFIYFFQMNTIRLIRHRAVTNNMIYDTVYDISSTKNIFAL